MQRASFYSDSLCLPVRSESRRGDSPSGRSGPWHAIPRGRSPMLGISRHSVAIIPQFARGGTLRGPAAVNAERGVHYDAVSNDGTHEWKSAFVRRQRMGPKPGPGVARSEDRHIPDRAARERAQADPVDSAPRLDPREAAGGRARCGIRDASAQRRGGSRARAALAVTAS